MDCLMKITGRSNLFTIILGESEIYFSSLFEIRRRALRRASCGGTPWRECIRRIALLAVWRLRSGSPAKKHANGSFINAPVRPTVAMTYILQPAIYSAILL
jgi:hypothetical protein